MAGIRASLTGYTTSAGSDAVRSAAYPTGAHATVQGLSLAPFPDGFGQEMERGGVGQPEAALMNERCLAGAGARVDSRCNRAQA